MTTEIEIMEGMIWTVAEDAGAPAICDIVADEQRPPAVTVPLADAVTPARVRRPWRYSPLAGSLAAGALAAWLTVTLISILSGQIVAGSLSAGWMLWHALGPVICLALLATIEPHAGSEHSAYAAQCTPSRNTITGRGRP